MALINIENISLFFPLRGQVATPAVTPSDGKNSVGASIISDEKGELFTHPLSNFSLRIENGQRVGLIGGNGAGKTTLLRVMSKSLVPQTGLVEIEGEIASLISLGNTLNPNLSGRENIIQRALWQGKSKKDILSKIDDIAEFTELRDYLEVNVSVYSAGMISRLLFATVTAFNPEILLMDEGIIVGDAQFQQRARRRMDDYMQQASIVVLASHSQQLLRNTCTHGVWLKNGKPRAIGKIGDILKAYNESS